MEGGAYWKEGAKSNHYGNMHFASRVNLFTKGMDLLNDDRLIRKQYIGLFATNLLNTFYGNSNIPLTHPPKWQTRESCKHIVNNSLL